MKPSPSQIGHSCTWSIYVWDANQLPDSEQQGHLDRCHALFAMSLQTAGDRMSEAVFTMRPDQHVTILPFFRREEDPVATITKWSSNRDGALEILHRYRGIFPTPVSMPSSSVWSLPLRSAAKLGRPFKPPEVMGGEGEGKAQAR